MEKLNQYGWKNYISKTGYSGSSDNIGRITSIKGNNFEIATEKGILIAEMLGRMMYAYEKWEQPKVGDWIRYIDYGENALIEEVLPRFNLLYRKTAGKETGKQVMVCNADKAVIIQGLDNDFNLKRLERYIVQSITCNVDPVIVLNKSDLVDDIKRFTGEIGRLQRDLKVYPCSLKTGYGLNEIKDSVFIPGTTNVLMGSSGVGKSSLINYLLNSKRRINEISDSTGKGKHTTTTRDLFLLENGAIVIDTPGMREFGVGFEDETPFDEQFPAISKFAGECKFKDCSHVHEEGCNVIKALENGELETVVYESYLKLLKEQKHFQTSLHEKKKQGKQFGKMTREAKEYRKRYKY